MSERVAVTEATRVADLTPLVGAYEVPLALIRRWHEQPRSWFEEESMAELTEDIKRHGIMEPLILRPDKRPDKPPGGFLITVGERRWRAARMAGLETVPALIRDVSTKQAVLDSLRENIQRQDLTPAEELEGLRRLVDIGLGAAEIALELGLSQANITRRLRVMDDEILGPAVANNQLSVAEAFELLPLGQDEQRVLLATVLTRTARGQRPTRDALRGLVQEQRRHGIASQQPERPSVAPVAATRSTQGDRSSIAAPLSVAVPQRVPTEPRARAVVGFPGVAPAPARIYPSSADPRSGHANSTVTGKEQSPSTIVRSDAGRQQISTRIPSAGKGAPLPADAVSEISTVERRAQSRAALRANDLRRHVEQQLTIIAQIYDAYSELPDVIEELQAVVRLTQKALDARPR